MVQEAARLVGAELPAEEARESRLSVVGGHPDHVGNELALLVGDGRLAQIAQHRLKGDVRCD